MTRKYLITGGAFALADGGRAVAGDTIELDDDVAATHAHLLQPVDAAAPTKPPVQTPARPAAKD
jgi:hypothetical protein